MFDKEVKVELRLCEVELLCSLLDERVKLWDRAIDQCSKGEQSLGELIDNDDEVDVEYQLEIFRKLNGRFGLLQRKHDRNNLEFIDESPIYRPEQSVEVIRVRGVGVDRAVYIFTSRHGSYFFYPSLEELINSFMKDKESRCRFECRSELEHFLYYWRE